MTHEIVKTENYLLVVDESEIKENDWVINENENIAIADENFIFFFAVTNLINFGEK